MSNSKVAKNSLILFGIMDIFYAILEVLYKKI